ncbi:MAG TPA: oxygen-independent coproporphyrinogen III oxidase [Bacteroidota bacterium]|nr:oxygen-independent coproporphyrinogen III oxidase [Bacteroidota bacterium]
MIKLGENYSTLRTSQINMTAPRADVDLLKKYSVPGPRYTSYPSAPVFSQEFSTEEYLSEIRDTNQPGENSPISVYVHLPYCDTLCYFCGCTMKVTSDATQITAYNQYLKKEIGTIAKMVSPARKVSQLHWGGGTPSYLSAEDIGDLGGFLKSVFAYADDVEAGVEIDPRGLTKGRMEAFREAGFNRTSMGVQDFDPEVQKAVNRIQSEKITRDAVDWSRELGFRSVNIDLIYGLPHQTVEEFARTVDTVIGLSPDRLAVFNYAHVPWLKPHQKVLDEISLPPPGEKLEIFCMTLEKLIGAGYENVGMDHFARPDDELAIARRNGTLYRNFQGYSTKAGCDLYAFGMSAISFLGGVYHQNLKSLRGYFAQIDRGRIPTHAGYRMTPDDVIRRDVIMKIMCDNEVMKNDIAGRYGISFDDYFRGALQKLGPFTADGLIELKTDRIIITPVGRLIVRNIAMCFDPHLETLRKDTPIFSKTV